MTNDPNLYITVAVSSLAGLGMVTAASLSGWRGWLACMALRSTCQVFMSLMLCRLEVQVRFRSSTVAS